MYINEICIMNYSSRFSIGVGGSAWSENSGVSSLIVWNKFYFFMQLLLFCGKLQATFFVYNVCAYQATTHDLPFEFNLLINFISCSSCCRKEKFFFIHSTWCFPALQVVQFILSFLEKKKRGGSQGSLMQVISRVKEDLLPTVSYLRFKMLLSTLNSFCKKNIQSVSVLIS